MELPFWHDKPQFLSAMFSRSMPRTFKFAKDKIKIKKHIKTEVWLEGDGQACENMAGELVENIGIRKNFTASGHAKYIQGIGCPRHL